MCQGLSKARWIFCSHFYHLMKQVVIFEAAGAVSKIGSSLKPNNYN